MSVPRYKIDHVIEYVMREYGVSFDLASLWVHEVIGSDFSIPVIPSEPRTAIYVGPPRNRTERRVAAKQKKRYKP